MNQEVGKSMRTNQSVQKYLKNHFILKIFFGILLIYLAIMVESLGL